MFEKMWYLLTLKFKLLMDMKDLWKHLVSHFCPKWPEINIPELDATGGPLMLFPQVSPTGSFFRSDPHVCPSCCSPVSFYQVGPLGRPPRN